MRILNQELANAFFLYGLKIEKRCFKKVLTCMPTYFNEDVQNLLS